MGIDRSLMSRVAAGWTFRRSAGAGDGRGRGWWVWLWNTSIEGRIEVKGLYVCMCVSIDG